MFAKSLIEIEILRKFEETPHTQKYEKTHWRKKQNGREEVGKPNDCSSRGKPNKHREKKQTGINAEKSQASIPENQLKWQEFTEEKSSLNHCVWNTIFYNRKALTGFWRSCLPERLNFPFAWAFQLLIVGAIFCQVVW